MLNCFFPAVLSVAALYILRLLLDALVCGHFTICYIILWQYDAFSLELYFVINLALLAFFGSYLPDIPFSVSFLFFSIILINPQVAQMVKNLPAMRETWVQSLGWKGPLEKEMTPTPVLLPGKSHGQRSLEGYSPWGHKESDVTEQLLLIDYSQDIDTRSFCQDIYCLYIITTSDSLFTIIINTIYCMRTYFYLILYILFTIYYIVAFSFPAFKRKYLKYTSVNYWVNKWEEKDNSPYRRTSNDKQKEWVT